MGRSKTKSARAAALTVAAALWFAATSAAGAQTTAPADAASTGAASTDAEATCGAVRVVAFDWPAAALASLTLERVLRDGLGCAVERAPGAPDAVARALASPDARRDGPPLVAPGLAADAAPAEQRGAELYGGDDQAGWFAPSWVIAVNPGLRSVSDLAAHAGDLRRLAPTGRRPQLHLCPAHWPCHADGAALAEALGLAPAFEIVTPRSGADLAASLRAAFDARAPWIGYAWTPSEIAAETRLRRLGDADYRICSDPEGVAAARLVSAAEATEDACRALFAEPPRITAYSADLPEAAPRVAALLSRFTIPAAAMEEALADVSRIGRGAAVAALLRARPEMWRAWLDDAAAAERFAASLAQ